MKTDNDIFDFSLSGKRIQLVFTDDPYTKLKPGNQGMIEYVQKNEGLEDQISIQWDNGSRLMLLVGKDEFIILDNEVAQ